MAVISGSTPQEESSEAGLAWAAVLGFWFWIAVIDSSVLMDTGSNQDKVSHNRLYWATIATTTLTALFTILICAVWLMKDPGHGEPEPSS